MSDALPEGWVTARIADLTVTASGGTPSTAKKEYWDGGDVPWINSGALKDSLIREPSTYITKLGLDNSSAKLFPPKTVVIALTGATTGKVGLLNFTSSTNQSVTGIFPSDTFFPEYLFYYLRSARDVVLKQAIGSAQPHINKRIVDDLMIPLAPLPEQRRIVAKLETLLGKVDACQKRLTKVPVLLKRFRQSVLAAACSGRLTRDWREDSSDSNQSPDDDGHTLPEELPGLWLYRPFKEFLESSFYGPRFSAESYSSDGVPTIRTTDMGFDGSIVLKDAPCVKLSPKELQKYGLQDGDLLVTRTGATIGKGALYWKELGPAIPGAYLIRFRLKRNRIVPKFVLLFFMSPAGQYLLVGGSTAVAQPNVNATTISQFMIPVPPLTEQREIVRRVEALLALADRIETRYQKAKAQVDRLSSSLLEKAFRGELVPTEAALAHAKGRDYEPASALLERIRAARTVGGVATKSRRVARKRKE